MRVLSKRAVAGTLRLVRAQWWKDKCEIQESVREHTEANEMNEQVMNEMNDKKCSRKEA